MSVSMLGVWIALSVIFFIAGMLIAWRRAQRRMQARMDDVVEEEFKRQMAALIAKELKEGSPKR